MKTELHSKQELGIICWLITPEIMKLLESTRNKIIKDNNGEYVPHLEITKEILVYCNVVNKDYWQDSIVFYTFVPNKSFGQLLDISSKKLIFSKTFNSEFSHNEWWFTDQNSKLIEIEDKMKISLVLNWCVTYKNDKSFKWTAISCICERI